MRWLRCICASDVANVYQHIYIFTTTSVIFSPIVQKNYTKSAAARCDRIGKKINTIYELCDKMPTKIILQY